MTLKNAILVDLDGTLADTESVNFIAYKLAFSEIGIKVDDSYLKANLGNNWRSFLPQILLGCQSSVSIDFIRMRKADIYIEKIGEVSINWGLVNLLKSLSNYFLIGLVTNASKRNVLSLLNYFELTDLFQVIVTGDDVSEPKPSPECYNLAARSLGVANANCIIFEDSYIGLASAIAFGGSVIQIKFP